MNHEELEQVIYERTRDFVSRRVMDCILELIAEEREACAAICDEMMRQLGEIGETIEAGGAGYCAEEIRNRGET